MMVVMVMFSRLIMTPPRHGCKHTQHMLSLFGVPLCQLPCTHTYSTHTQCTCTHPHTTPPPLLLCQVWNPCFDVTPGTLIEGIITEEGVVPRDPGTGQHKVAAFMAARQQAAAQQNGTAAGDAGGSVCLQQVLLMHCAVSAAQKRFTVEVESACQRMSLQTVSVIFQQTHLSLNSHMCVCTTTTTITLHLSFVYLHLPLSTRPHSPRQDQAQQQCVCP